METAIENNRVFEDRSHRKNRAGEDELMPPRDVRKSCGNISDMTLWRWVKSRYCGFPEPVYIGRRRYWFRSEINEFLENLRTQ